MGPQPSSRGNDKFLNALGGAVGLQWGRNLPVAEIANASASFTNSIGGFNGAATFQSRKSKRSSMSEWLQLASMGPQPSSRGNQNRLREATARANEALQWGRNLPVAEIRLPRRGAARARGSFNGAATFQSRKCLGRHPSSGVLGASMGPQPSSRGNSVRASICVALTPFCAGFPLRGMLVPYYLSVQCRHFDS